MAPIVYPTIAAIITIAGVSTVKIVKLVETVMIEISVTRHTAVIASPTSAKIVGINIVKTAITV